MARAGGFIGEQPTWSATQRSGVWSIEEQYQAELASTWPLSIDPDVRTYVAAVESADGQALESAVIRAYDSFVLGCKADGIWSAIKASCILAGARTLAGALVPLVGTAPTNNGPFVSGDYDRGTGLVGDGSTKYLNSNRNNNADPQDSNHNAVYVSSFNITAQFIAAGTSGDGANNISTAGTRSRSSTFTNASPQTGFLGISRSGSASYSYRDNNSTANISVSSLIPFNGNIFIFARNSSGSVNSYSDARLSFYSIGESLDLALLDTRVSRLINEIAFYLNTGLDGSVYDIDTLKYVNAGYTAGGTLS